MFSSDDEPGTQRDDGTIQGTYAVQAKPGTQWLRPGLIARVRYLKGEQGLRHATLFDEL